MNAIVILMFHLSKYSKETGVAFTIESNDMGSIIIKMTYKGANFAMNITADMLDNIFEKDDRVEEIGKILNKEVMKLKSDYSKFITENDCGSRTEWVYSKRRKEITCYRL